MLTGHRAFPGEDVAETLAAVIRGEPDWKALPADVPPALVRLMRRCLAKDVRSRLRDAGDARWRSTMGQRLCRRLQYRDGPANEVLNNRFAGPARTAHRRTTG